MVIMTYATADDAMRTDKRIRFLSVVYCLAIILIGVVLAIKDIHVANDTTNSWYITLLTALGLTWLSFLLWDVRQYKNFNDRPTGDHINEHKTSDNLQLPVKPSVFRWILHYIDHDKFTGYNSAYHILPGFHAGNRFFKTGMIVFCVGSMIHLGIDLIDRLYSSVQSDRCRDYPLMIMLTAQITKNFQQLFISLYYTNIIINRYTTIARFALMHLMGTSLVMWFNTIIEEAIDDYVIETLEYGSEWVNDTEANTRHVYHFQDTLDYQSHCFRHSVLDFTTMEIMSYFYIFTIDYNILCASVWFIIWSKKQDDTAEEQWEMVAYHPRQSAHHTLMGFHTFHWGLLTGVLALVTMTISIIIFFSTIYHYELHTIAVSIYTSQLGFTALVGCAIVPLAYLKLRRLDRLLAHKFYKACKTMDDILVLTPIPFIAVHYILVIKATDDHTNGIILKVIYCLNILQAVLQTPLLMDGIRRCGNTEQLRHDRPGRELITFALVLNVCYWVINTVERKAIASHDGMADHYGEMTWMVISHTTIPISLFYRFHSAICLSDIRKHAYEKDITLTKTDHGDHNGDVPLTQLNATDKC